MKRKSNTKLKREPEVPVDLVVEMNRLKLDIVETSVLAVLIDELVAPLAWNTPHERLTNALERLRLFARVNRENLVRMVERGQYLVR